MPTAIKTAKTNPPICAETLMLAAAAGELVELPPPDWVSVPDGDPSPPPVVVAVPLPPLPPPVIVPLPPTPPMIPVVLTNVVGIEVSPTDV